jgi:glycerol-3-phosphate dehydrogenase (NAD(P)+)
MATERLGQRVAVVGAGSWGTTLALVAGRAGHRVGLWARDPAAAAAIGAARRNDRYLPGATLPDAVEVTADLAEACRGAAIVVVVVPSQTVRELARALAPLAGAAVVVSAAKGLERGSLKRMSEVLRDELGPAAAARVCALSGPNLAPEVAAGKPAAAVIASEDQGAAELARDLLMGPQFRCYTNEDVVGVEMGGALKNVIAIGAGLADGLAAGENAKAAFLTRGIAEIARLGVAVGAQPLTFAGLTGLGDLVATCASPLSRNRLVGQELAKGRSLAEIRIGMTQVAEGVFTTEAARELGRRAGVELPITEQVYEIMYAGKPPLAALAELMRREPKDELEGLRSIPYPLPVGRGGEPAAARD